MLGQPIGLPVAGQAEYTLAEFTVGNLLVIGTPDVAWDLISDVDSCGNLLVIGVPGSYDSFINIPPMRLMKMGTPTILEAPVVINIPSMRLLRMGTPTIIRGAP